MLEVPLLVLSAAACQDIELGIIMNWRRPCPLRGSEVETGQVRARQVLRQIGRAQNESPVNVLNDVPDSMRSGRESTLRPRCDR